jgi:hypothetical protein
VSKGKHSFGISDRSGARYKLTDLVEQYRDGFPTGLRVGRDEVDQDHPQLRIGDVDAADDMSLDDPRPDTNLAESRALTAWDPVGGGITEMGTRTVGLDVVAHVGRVTVT